MKIRSFPHALSENDVREMLESLKNDMRKTLSKAVTDLSFENLYRIAYTVVCTTAGQGITVLRRTDQVEF